MGTILDHIGASLIAGIVLLSLIAVTLSLQETNTDVVLDYVMQRTLTDVTASVESDLRKIGYRVPRSVSRVRSSQASDITFLADIDNSGSIDTVRYYLGSTTELEATINPNDRPLYRVVNGRQMQGSSFGCTDFQLTYYDSLGNATTNPALVRQVAVKITVQSKSPNGERYAETYWQSRIKPMNLTTRHLN